MVETTVRLLVDDWPWGVAIGWLLIYEAVAIWTGPPTLSRLVWVGRERWRWLWLVVLVAFVLLYGHFFFDWWRYDPPEPVQVIRLPEPTGA